MDTNLYMISYNDLSNVLYELDEVQINMLYAATERQATVIIPGLGLMVTRDIRSIVIQKPLPEENPSFDPDLSEAEKEHIRQFEIAERLHKEFEAEEDADDDSDYKGGMMP